MTREEAIKYLELHKYANTCGHKSLEESNEAIDMAIEALQWQDRILTQIEDIMLKEHGERREE